MFEIGDAVLSLLAVDEVPIDSLGRVVAVGSAMFDDSIWVDFAPFDCILECDPDWLARI